jgi:hypothetical protein
MTNWGVIYTPLFLRDIYEIILFISSYFKIFGF